MKRRKSRVKSLGSYPRKSDHYIYGQKKTPHKQKDTFLKKKNPLLTVCIHGKPDLMGFKKAKGPPDLLLFSEVGQRRKGSFQGMNLSGA